MIGLFRKNNVLEGELQSDYHGLEPDTRARLLTCCHCQFTWKMRADAKNPMGEATGFCTRCMGHVCGRSVCRANGCVHWEQHLENLEKGNPLDFRPVIVSVPELG